MERLSGLDASFLYAESSTVPLNVCSVVELDTSTTIAKSNTGAKEHSRAIAPSLVLDLTQVVTRAMFGFVLGVAGHTSLTHTAIHNVIISNVAGPRNKLYFLGAEIKALYPLGPIFHGSGLNITVMSLSGKLNVGIISCQQLVDDLWGLADGFNDALEELLECAGPARN